MRKTRPLTREVKHLHHAAGFTLLEVLVVVFIVGIIVSFASLSINQNTSRLLEDEAQRLHGLIRLASEESVLKGHELALQFQKQVYRFVKLEDDQWQPVRDDRLLRERSIPEELDLTLVLEGVAVSLDSDSQAPKIVLLSSGEITPFELTLTNSDGEHYVLRGDLNGALNLQQGGQ